MELETSVRPEDRDAFQQMVRIWQYAAYGQRLPAAEDFETLLQTLADGMKSMLK